MLRSAILVLAAATFLLAQASLFAGGPALLCLPIEGVNRDNSQECATRLASRLRDRWWHDADLPGGVQAIGDSSDWRLAYYLDDDVRLSDVDAALKESDFSIPLDRLRMFGHVVLEIEAAPSSRAGVLADLEALPHVAVDELETRDGLLIVTVDMPYPDGKWRTEEEPVAWKSFQRTDFSSNRSAETRDPANVRDLPSYEDFRELAKRRDARLKDVCWSARHACRPLGCVADEKETTSVTSAE